jgi:MYXO-CTERM domain-containing protein
MRSFAASILALAAVPSVALAQGAAPECGYDCSRPGRYVICNDSVELNNPGQMINCGASLGACTGEAFCGSFRLPATSTTTHLRQVWTLMGPSAPAGDQFDLEVYVERNMDTPGARIAGTVNNNYALVGDPQNFQFIDLAVHGDAYELFTNFRLCFRKQFDGSHNVCYDTDGQGQRANWMYARVAFDCTTPASSFWTEASTFGVNGDFIIRPEVEISDLSAWRPGGVCNRRPDAGVMDATPMDAAAPDAMPPPPDAGFAMDATAPDEGFAMDAAPLDTGPQGMDASAPPPDSGPMNPADAGVVGRAPQITGISPARATNDAPVDLLVAGNNFAQGLTLKIGAIAAENVRVPGPTTITATVPPNIAPGVYDVSVRNPDGQAALLPAAFTVLAKDDPGSSSPPPSEGCGCRGSGQGSPWLFGALALLALLLRRR